MGNLRLVALCLLLASCGGKSGVEPEVRESNALPAAGDDGPPVPCPGLYAREQQSSSYLPGAPAVTEDGQDMELKLTVIDPRAGSCAPAANVVVEIWHTGTSGYLPDRWRTALRTDKDGRIIYRTVRPTDTEGFPHYHLRTTLGQGEIYEWVLGVDETTGNAMEVGLVLGYQPETPPDPPKSGVDPQV